MDSKSKSDEISWRGCPMNEIYRNSSEWELKHAPQIRPSDNHTVLYHWPLNNFNEPPKPRKGHNKWDAFHVRLPCSSKNQYPVTQSDGSIEIENRWLMIEKALLKPIKNSQELETAILSYNSKYQNIWKFRALHKMFEEELEEEETMLFFEDILPKIIRLALRLPEIITTSIPLLKQEQNRSISMSQQQVACLLANAFLCTFPRRNTTKKKSEYSSFPDINFNRLFQSSGHQVIEKIKCIINYFRRVCNKTPTGVLTFVRRSLTDPELPNWDECDTPLSGTPFHITSCGTIEDQGHGLLQVDFANKFLGGGVLGSGCVQEEIRFVICPELIISKLFTEALKPCEALLMIGCEQFSKYTGYASSFRWDGNFDDKTPFDDSGRRKCHIVAIDALYFAQSSHQYREELILRELNKAYVGFIHPLETTAPGVASGNWGCGAFGGEASLKALIQLMACTVTKRPLVYFTFGNRELRDNVYNMYNFFIENNITVKQLWKYLKEFHNHKLSPNDLYSFIIQIHRDNQQSEKSNSNSLKINEKIQSFPVEMPSSIKNQDIIKTTKDNDSLETITLSRNLNNTSISMNNVRIRERSSSPEDIDYFKIIETYKTSKNNVEKPIDNLRKNDDKSISIVQQSCKKHKASFKSLMLTTKHFDNPNKNEKIITSVSEKLVMKDCEEITSLSGDKKLNGRKSNDSSSGSVTPKKSNESLKTSKNLKQKSLLDMFDVFYGGSERPAKRYCDSSNQDKK